MESNENPSEECSTGSIKRRDLLNSATAAGISVIGINSVSAKTSQSTVHFIEKGWSFDVDLPDNFRRETSIVHIDEPLLHKVDTESHRLHIAPKAPHTVRERLLKQDIAVFGNGFRDLPPRNHNGGRISFNNGIIPLSISEDTRQVTGMSILEPLEMDRPRYSTNGNDLEISTAPENTIVQANSTISKRMTQKTLKVEERIPARDPRNSKETRAPIYKEHEIRATPILTVRNHGELDIFFDTERGGSQ